jgi:hypothetical protein
MRGGKRPGAGRPKGSKNKRSVPQERAIIQRNVALAMQRMNGERRLEEATTEAQARGAIAEIERAKAKQVPLAKDAMATFLGIFMSRAGFYNSKGIDPTTKKDRNPNADEARFEKYARLAVETAKSLAPYQSPTFRAIMMAPPPPDNAGPRRFTLTIHDGRGKTAIVETNAALSAPTIDAIAEDESEDGSS